MPVDSAVGGSGLVNAAVCERDPVEAVNAVAGGGGECGGVNLGSSTAMSMGSGVICKWAGGIAGLEFVCNGAFVTATQTHTQTAKRTQHDPDCVRKFQFRR